MASIIKRARRQLAIYWAQNSVPGGFGTRTYAAPVQVRCRWDQMQEEVKRASGDTIISTAQVMVDRVMKEGDMLALGELDSSVSADPTDSGCLAVKIVAFEETPNLKATEFLRIAYLSNNTSAGG